MESVVKLGWHLRERVDDKPWRVVIVNVVPPSRLGHCGEACFIGVHITGGKCSVSMCVEYKRVGIIAHRAASLAEIVQ